MAITTEGRNHMLDVTLHGTSPVGTWYIGLVGTNHTYNAADTLASHAGWDEYSHYTGNRVAWSEGAASSGSSTGSGASAFTISGATGSETVNGAFLCSAASGTTGTLFGTGDFSGGAKSVANSDTLTVTVTVSLTAT